MDDGQALRICQMTDTTRINNLFQPLNKVRVVGTDTHRQAGQVSGLGILMFHKFRIQIILQFRAIRIYSLLLQYLKDTLDAAGMTTEWDEFVDSTPLGARTFRTLIATANPQAPRRLTLACHYDSKIFK